jgi:antibiotic biosynthesis monooxygenase (ABM) superfamily enzyme
MPIHIAITRRVRPGCEADFQQALREFFQDSFAHGGVLGATMIVPPPGSDSREFGILRTFADEKERDAFYASPIFKAWEKKSEPLAESGASSQRPLHGLEAWFPPHNPPPKWKMAFAVPRRLPARLVDQGPVFADGVLSTTPSSRMVVALAWL